MFSKFDIQSLKELNDAINSLKNRKAAGVNINILEEDDNWSLIVDGHYCLGRLERRQFSNWKVTFYEKADTSSGSLQKTPSESCKFLLTTTLDESYSKGQKKEETLVGSEIFYESILQRLPKNSFQRFALANANFSRNSELNNH